MILTRRGVLDWEERWKIILNDSADEKICQKLGARTLIGCSISAWLIREMESSWRGLGNARVWNFGVRESSLTMTTERQRGEEVSGFDRCPLLERDEEHIRRGK